MSQILPIFQSEDASQPAASAVVMHGDSLSLADLQRSGVPLEWFEVVAIVQALCRTIFSAGDRIGPAALNAEDVRIDATGDVSAFLSESKDGPAAVRNVAEITRGLLPDRNVPTPLRLVLTQASFHTALDQLYAALEPFERPNGTELIRGVYARWMGTPHYAAPPPASRSRSRKGLTQGTRASLAQTASLPFVQRYRSRIRLATGTVAAVLGIAVLTAVGVRIKGWVGSRSTQDLPAASLTAAQNTADRVLDRVLPPQPAVPASEDGNGSVIQSGRPVTDAGVPSAGPQAFRSRREWIVLEPERRAPRPRAAAQASRPLLPSVPPQVQPASVAPARLGSSGSVAFPLPPLPSERRPPVVRAVQASPRMVNAAVYAENDNEVVPPSAIYPRFPTVKPAGVDLVEFNVLISEAGTVESVHALRAPETIAEAMVVTMSLSASKTWRFSPATKDGEPVRYRKVVWVPAH